MAQKLAEKIKQGGFGNARVEGLPAADWVLIDAGDVVVHLFRPEVRSFYNLERMWGFGDEKAAAGGTA
jgi:ribosome-associated protein